MAPNLNYKLRKATVFKKAKELSTLCNVDVLLILYDNHHQEHPQTWCSKPDSTSIINKYLSNKGTKRTTKKSKKSNPFDDPDFINKLGPEDLMNFVGVLDGKIEYVNQKINQIKGMSSVQDYSNNCNGNFSDQRGNFDYAGCINVDDYIHVGDLVGNSDALNQGFNYCSNSNNNSIQSNCTDDVGGNFSTDDLDFGNVSFSQMLQGTQYNDDDDIFSTLMNDFTTDSYCFDDMIMFDDQSKVIPEFHSENNSKTGDDVIDLDSESFEESNKSCVTDKDNNIIKGEISDGLISSVDEMLDTQSNDNNKLLIDYKDGFSLADLKFEGIGGGADLQILDDDNDDDDFDFSKQLKMYESTFAAQISCH